MLRENDFLRRTEGQLDEFIGRGMAVLDNLVEQRGFLKVSISNLEAIVGLMTGVGDTEKVVRCWEYVGIESGYDTVH